MDCLSTNFKAKFECKLIFVLTVNVKKEEVIKATNISKEFSFQEIRIATNNLSELLGRGGFGPVYKGTLSTGSHVAIKILANASQQGAQEFLNEVFGFLSLN